LAGGTFVACGDLDLGGSDLRICMSLRMGVWLGRGSGNKMIVLDLRILEIYRGKEFRICFATSCTGN
jgi:hypothetical protein